MLGRQVASKSRVDRAVGLLLANAAAWDQLSADDHAMLAHLPTPHGPVFAWFEAQLHEHGPQPWAALREALRGESFEAYVCAEVEQATVAADSAAELGELAGVMDLLRRDELMRLSQALSQQAETDPGARERLRELNERIKAIKPGQPV
jgi:DNA primase